MDLVLDAGQTLLENGGEVFRAQDTMEIMARSLGVEDFSVYVLTNGIFASAEDGTVSVVRHIPFISMHLARVEAVNALSRQLAAGEIGLTQAEDALRTARALPEADRRAVLLAASLGSCSFAFLFGGGLAECLVAGLAGFAEMAVSQWFSKRGINRIFTDITAAALATALALLARAVWPALNVNTATIGALMVLTPGVALTMGIRDFINADYLSGTIRLFSAVLVAGSLACGVAIIWMAAQGLGVLV